jgi:hypothetical protein
MGLDGEKERWVCMGLDGEKGCKKREKERSEELQKEERTKGNETPNRPDQIGQRRRQMLRKLIATATIALALAGSMTSTWAQRYEEPRTGTSSQPQNAPSGGGQDRPFDPE